MSILNRNSRRRNSYTSARRSSGSGKNSVSNGNRRRSGESSVRRKKNASRSHLPSIRIRARGMRRLVVWGSALLILGILVAGGGMGMLKIYQFFTTSEYFTVTSIEVSGNSQVRTEDILSACNLEKGMNSLSVNVQAAEQALMKNPWIEHVTIRRELPGSFVIEIKERVPHFCARKDGRLYYINTKGEIIAPVTAKNFRSLPVLEIGPGGEDSLALVASFVEEFRQAGFPFDISQISWIRVSAGSGFELYWENKKLRLSIGTEHWKDNLKRIASVVTDIEKRKETVMVTSIRAADGQVWMTKNTGEETDTAEQ